MHMYNNCVNLHFSLYLTTTKQIQSWISCQEHKDDHYKDTNGNTLYIECHKYLQEASNKKMEYKF